MKVFIVSIIQKRGDDDRCLYLKEEYNPNDGSLEFTEEQEEAHQYSTVDGAETSINSMLDSQDLLETLNIANFKTSWEIAQRPLVVKKIDS